MTDAERRRRERTGKHLCASCLRETPADEYFDGDFYCAECAKRAAEYPLATTPDHRKREERK